jgi:hypothetical protein
MNAPRTTSRPKAPASATMPMRSTTAPRTRISAVVSCNRRSKSVQEARAYYATEFLDFRRKKPTPYMEKLHFASAEGTADPDTRILSDEDLEAAMREGEKQS